MAIDLYLYFDGNCRDAVTFYSEVFEIEKQQIMTFGEAPEDPNNPLPQEAKNRVLHTFLNIKGSKVMMSDIFPEMPFIVGNNISLTLNSHDMGEMKIIFNRLVEGGQVQLELQETFWSPFYGQVTDQFGITWQLNYVSL